MFMADITNITNFTQDITNQQNPQFINDFISQINPTYGLFILIFILLLIWGLDSRSNKLMSAIKYAFLAGVISFLLQYLKLFGG